MHAPGKAYRYAGDALCDVPFHVIVLTTSQLSRSLTGSNYWVSSVTGFPDQEMAKAVHGE